MIIKSMAKPPKNSLAAKKAQGKEQSLIQLFEMVCHICAQRYNSSDRLPFAICPEEHTYCSQCVQNLFSRSQHGATKCPTCRVNISKSSTHVNKTVLRVCDMVVKMAEKFSSLEEQKEELSRRLDKAAIEISKLRMESLHANKENKNQNQEDKSQFNGFPIIKKSEGDKKINKMNIHSFMAVRRRAVSGSERQGNSKNIGNPN